jgi:hypothetical protein
MTCPCRQFVCFIAVAAALVAGCGEDTHEVRGIVTWQGEPVPVGVVQFEPTTAMGDAPTGFALIQQGRFVTEPQRGCLPGPHLARIKGFDGKPLPLDPALAAERVPGYDDEPPLAAGTPLFEDVLMEVDIVRGVELKLELPASQ